ncbi:LPXTG cell wall anchor domain-containing protein [Dolosigranulum pigrum]|uniref:collagen-flanked surface repeat-containing protein n=1 Tax=Dolosigranulum pigrum TaxID=29394 RepID=UPI00155E2C8D|nr:LPXTG cell wall anchor domain-containing protein [Dolosigranulum pigrum]
MTASVERGEQNGRPGTYVIIRNEDGTEIDREFIFDGENGQTPTIESSNVLDADGQTVGTRIIIRDGNGRIVGDQIIRNGKDGKNGQDGKDGETPTIGSNGNWFIAGKDTGVKAKGEDGQSITITKETRDADGNTIVHFSDGSTVTISKGDKGDQGQKGDKGERGQTPNVSQTPIRDQNGRIVGYTLTFTDPVTGEKIGNSIDVYNGTDGKDGKSVTASVERGEQNGRPGSYIIIRNEDGVELDREFVFDGEDGTTPKVSVQTIERNDGRKTHVVTITNPKTGETQTFTVTDGEKGQPGQAGKDGRDGKNGFTPTIGSNGNWFIAGQDTGVKAKGEDGQSITVTKEVKDEQGNTVVHFSDGSTITISKGDRGETGPAGKDGRDGRDGRDGKDGKDLTGNNGNINIENSNNQSQDQNQTQNQNSNQVVTNNTYNFGDVSLTINQTLNLNGEVVLTKIIVKDKDGLTNETQIDKNTQINQLNVFVNNGQVLVGTFNLTNQNNVKQLLVGNLIINLVINNDSADNPTVPKKPEQPETTPERPSETPDNTPEQPNETPNVPSTPGQPGETPEAPGTNETPDNTPEQPNETPNVPSTPGQPGETPEAPGTNETPDNTPEQPNETPEVPSTPEETPGTPGQPGETPEAPGTNETPDNTPEQPNETPNTPTQLSNTSAQPDRSSITGERLPETATDSWMLALASLVSLSSGAVLAVKKKKDDE